MIATTKSRARENDFFAVSGGPSIERESYFMKEFSKSIPVALFLAIGVNSVTNAQIKNAHVRASKRVPKQSFPTPINANDYCDSFRRCWCSSPTTSTWAIRTLAYGIIPPL